MTPLEDSGLELAGVLAQAGKLLPQLGHVPLLQQDLKPEDINRHCQTSFPPHDILPPGNDPNHIPR